MKDFGKVRSTEKPDELVTDSFSVWVHTDITPISENVGEENEFVGFEYNMIQYDKDEYIHQITKSTSEQITDLQLALTEVYESMGV
ncbi:MULTISPECIES: hypothetical protein [Erysipelotrichaceae]|jgi:hypothetical protein|uniref:hypothetical protein n=1 Tax=Erysipelotrichaceae TaxID=128827 RepID=UPI000E50FF26|nr:hypothetical protein [Absiella sp. AM27-20]RHU07196.1 hypothetical protein DW716_09365 [Absiella sp. AM27-20]DAZ35775.1 MAG TPA: hypothetical protein [Caudoviricetes sp.]